MKPKAFGMGEAYILLFPYPEGSKKCQGTPKKDVPDEYLGVGNVKREDKKAVEYLESQSTGGSVPRSDVKSDATGVVENFENAKAAPCQ